MTAQWSLVIRLKYKAIFTSGPKKKCWLAVLYMLMLWKSLYFWVSPCKKMELISIRASKISLNHLLLFCHSPKIFQINGLLSSWFCLELWVKAPARYIKGLFCCTTMMRCSLIVWKRFWRIFRNYLNQSSTGYHGLIPNYFAWFLFTWIVVVTPRVSTDIADTGSDDKAEIREALEYIVTIFRNPRGQGHLHLLSARWDWWSCQFLEEAPWESSWRLQEGLV